MNLQTGMTVALVGRRALVLVAVAVTAGASLAATQSETAFSRAAKEVQSVYTITGNSSTRSEARKVIAAHRWSDVLGSQQADAAFVVLRAGSARYRLNDTYESLLELERDADANTNSSGAFFQLSLFVARGGRMEMLAHTSYAADGG